MFKNIEIGADVPCYFIADDQCTHKAGFGRALTGWRHSSEVEPIFDTLDLIVLDNRDTATCSWEAFLDGRLSLLPRLALIRPGQAAPSGTDAVIDSQTSEAIQAGFDLWRPTPDAHSFASVAQGFGAAAVQPIARRLSDQLQQAITDLDAGSLGDAHRIAGVAGTMGFRRASRAWLAIDEGDLTDLAAARREARLAVVAIERWLAATESARDSGA